ALGLFVLAGVLSMMLALGSLIAALGVPSSRLLAYVVPLTDVVILSLGVLLVLDRQPFAWLPHLHVRVPTGRYPWLSAYVYGLLYGPLALPCSSPLVVGVFAVGLTYAEALDRLSAFVWFGIGVGTPLLALSVLSSSLQRHVTSLVARRSRLLNALGGGL